MASSWKALPAVGVSLSAFLLFALLLPGWGHVVLLASVAAAWLLDRLVHRRHAITFPWRTGQPWTKMQKSYVVAVPLQGWIFTRTKSLTYVVVVHLLFDVIVFLAIIHAHNPHWLSIFVY